MKLDAKRREHVAGLYRSRKHTVQEICELVGISRATLYAYANEVPQEA